MTTVPKADTPAPANNADTLLISSPEDLYVRPTAGGNRAGTGGDAPAGVVPPNPIKNSILDAYQDPSYPVAEGGSSPSEGDTQAGPDMGYGATIVQPDMQGESGEPDGNTVGGGTVGNSGDQG